ncbi:DUF4260 family protein [Tardiphaga sp. 215_C5_N2_1]|uniref:DUF4260 family protein n=1 Tax=Tardiphaga sp. 215_C5_N2_1 TaxID=3240774 RepID=UPI003F8C86B9
MAENLIEEGGAATGGVRELLRWEGVALFVGMTFVYYISGAPLTHYALFFFAPDLSAIAYVFGRRAGVCMYNVAHATLAPMVVVLVGLLIAEPLAGSLAMIWFARIGLARAFGQGLRYSSGKGSTHLG